jgi:hypothetical protein
MDSTTVLADLPYMWASSFLTNRAMGYCSSSETLFKYALALAESSEKLSFAVARSTDVGAFLAVTHFSVTALL